MADGMPKHVRDYILGMRGREVTPEWGMDLADPTGDAIDRALGEKLRGMNTDAVVDRTLGEKLRAMNRGTAEGQRLADEELTDSANQTLDRAMGEKFKRIQEDKQNFPEPWDGQPLYDGNYEKYRIQIPPEPTKAEQLSNGISDFVGGVAKAAFNPVLVPTDKPIVEPKPGDIPGAPTPRRESLEATSTTVTPPEAKAEEPKPISFDERLAAYLAAKKKPKGESDILARLADAEAKSDRANTRAWAGNVGASFAENFDPNNRGVARRDLAEYVAKQAGIPMDRFNRRYGIEKDELAQENKEADRELNRQKYAAQLMQRMTELEIRLNDKALDREARASYQQEMMRLRRELGEVQKGKLEAQNKRTKIMEDENDRKQEDQKINAKFKLGKMVDASTWLNKQIMGRLDSLLAGHKTEIPGVGVIEGGLPGLLKSGKGRAIQQHFQQLANSYYKLMAGTAVSGAEEERVGRAVGAMGAARTEQEFMNGVQLFRDAMDGILIQAYASSPDEVVREYATDTGLYPTSHPKYGKGGSLFKQEEKPKAPAAPPLPTETSTKEPGDDSKTMVKLIRVRDGKSKMATLAQAKAIMSSSNEEFRAEVVK